MRAQDVKKVSGSLVVGQNILIPTKYQLPYQVANSPNQQQY